MVICMMIILRLLVLVAAADSPSPSPSSVNTVMCLPDERDTLLSFKTAFSIDNSSGPLFCFAGSRAKTNSWEKNGNCCKWDGVTCDPQTSHVVELDLSCSHLSGSIPSNTTLFRLPRLRYLNLRYNLLSGQVPPEIGWLSHLTTLDLSANFKDQFIMNPSLIMPNFPTIIANMTDLRYLDLSFVSLASYLPPIIFNFSKLTYLGLYKCDLEGEFPIADVNHVNTSMLARVTEIDLSYNMQTGTIPGWLFTRQSLKYLSLDNNLFTGLSEFEIGYASSLSWFNAESNLLQGEIPDGIFELHNLEGLNLQKKNLTGTILLSKIHNFQLMDRLILSDNKLSIIDDMDFFDSKPSLPMFDILSLSSCNLSHFPSFLREQTNLTQLDLSNNNIHGKVPDWLLDIGTLQSLNISHNLLHGGLEHLPRKNLDEIDIQHNLFHGVVIVPSSTSYFWASSNLFSGAIPPSLCTLVEKPF